MKDYEALSDEELLVLHRAGDARAEDTLYARYKQIVRSKARTYFLIGADREDIIQEGMIGLYKAVLDYQSDRQASFRSFAELCITRQIISAIKSATRKKHMPLNTYISFNRSVFDGDNERPLIDVLTSTRMTDPEEVLIGRENYAAVADSIEHSLSKLEHNALGHCGEAFAIQIDHRTPHAQQRPGIGQVLQTGDGRLRTQRAGPRGCQIERHLEHRIDAQAGCIIAILIACSDHHQPEPDDVGKAMRDVLGRARILDTGRQTIGHAKALLDLAQQQNPAIR